MHVYVGIFSLAQSWLRDTISINAVFIAYDSNIPFKAVSLQQRRIKFRSCGGIVID
jgi:hypothetical protein